MKKPHTDTPQISICKIQKFIMQLQLLNVKHVFNISISLTYRCMYIYAETHYLELRTFMLLAFQ